MRKMLAFFVVASCIYAEAATLGQPKQTIRPASASPAPGSTGFATSFAYPKTVDLAGTPYLSAWLEGVGTELLVLKENGKLELLADICPGPCASTPTHLTPLNGLLIFSAYSPASGRRLWTSDGTTANTRPVFDEITSDTPMFSSPFPGLYTEGSSRRYMLHNGALYFSGITSDHGAELWRTDGTATGTTRLTDINPDTGSAHPQHLTACGAALCFIATDGDRVKPWLLNSSDQLQALPEPADTLVIELLGATTTHLFWRAQTDTGDHALVSYDLSDGTSALLRDFSDLEPTARIQKASFAADKLYFHIWTDSNLHPEVWVSDGSADGTAALVLSLDETATSRILASTTNLLLLVIEYPSSFELARFDGANLVTVASFTAGALVNPLQLLDDAVIFGVRNPDAEQGKFLRVSAVSEQEKDATATDINLAELQFIFGASQKSETYFYHSFPDLTLPGAVKTLDFDTADQTLIPSWQVGPLADRTLQHNGALFYLGTDGELYRATRDRISIASNWLDGYAPSGLTPFSGGSDISLFNTDKQIWGLPRNSRALIPVYDGTGLTVVAIEEQLFYSLDEDTKNATLLTVTADGDIQIVKTLSAPERFMGFGSAYNASTATHWLVSIANGSSYRLVAIDRQTLAVTDLDMFLSDQHFFVSGSPAGLFTVQTYDLSSDTTSLWLIDVSLTNYEKFTEFPGAPQQSAIIIPGDSLVLLFAQQNGTSQQVMRMTYGGSAHPLTDKSGAVLKDYSKTAHVKEVVYLAARASGSNPTLWKVTETGPAIPVLAGVKGTHHGPTLVGPVQGGILFESSNSKRRLVYSLTKQPDSSPKSGSSGSSNSSGSSRSSGITSVGYLALMSLLLFRRKHS